MCDMKEYGATNLVGYDLDVLAIVGQKSTNGNSVQGGDGDIIGFSVGENYSRVQLGQITLDLDLASEKLFQNVPLTQFLPDGERQMWPLKNPIKADGKSIKANLNIRVAGLDVNNKIVLIAHHKRNNC